MLIARAANNATMSSERIASIIISSFAVRESRCIREGNKDVIHEMRSPWLCNGVGSLLRKEKVRGFVSHEMPFERATSINFPEPEAENKNVR